MKRLRCRPSPWGQFFSPRAAPRFHLRTSTSNSSSRTAASFPSPTQTRHSSTNSSSRQPPSANGSDPRPPLPPCRDPFSSAKLAALHARLSLHPRFPKQTLARALIDVTADPNPLFNNASLSMLGRTLAGYYASEHFLCTYPRLPTQVLGAAIAAFVGPKALAALCREWGVESAFEPKADVDAGLLQFRRLPPGEEQLAPHMRELAEKLAAEGGGVGEELAMSRFVEATFAGVYLHEGVAASKQFFRQHVLSRRLDVDRLFNFIQPTRELSRLCAREGFDPPVARWISETGRRSIAPAFVVGIYSGLDKIGEGDGGSMDEARIRAAVHALKGWYLYTPPTGNVDFPSKTDCDPRAPFKPAIIDVGEVIV